MTARSSDAPVTADALLNCTQRLRRKLSGSFRDELVEAIYADAKTIADRAVSVKGDRRWDWDQKIDRLLTSPAFGLPLMLA
ncbi:MAG: hypothetical protein ACYS1E_10770, partial [Planctomycetota bacterium]